MSCFSANPHPADGADRRPDPIDRYLDLVRLRPDLFVPSPEVPLVLDPARLRAFTAETSRPVGLVFDNRPYYMVLADLCESGGQQYVYGRVVYPRPDTSGTVAIPVHNGRFGLLRIFRHAHRAECLEFPRGYAEPELTPEENIRKELAEEMGAAVGAVRFLGQVRPDTGLSAGCAQVFLAEVTQAGARVGHEGIRALLWLTGEELRRAIAEGAVTDGISLAALTLLACENGGPFLPPD